MIALLLAHATGVPHDHDDVFSIAVALVFLAIATLALSQLWQSFKSNHRE